MENGSFVDFYDLLMIRDTADLQMLEASVRVMLARYNPKNEETGDPEKFELVKRAYLTLSDSDQREAYEQQRKQHYQIEPTTTPELGDTLRPEQIQRERDKRRGVMILLYQRMVTNSHEPSLSVPHLGEKLSVVAEELQFAFWFLRERGLITRISNGNFQITANGVAWVEDGGIPHAAERVEVSGASGAHPEKTPNKAPARNGIEQKSGVSTSAA